jgi:hypothetical protein
VDVIHSPPVPAKRRRFARGRAAVVAGVVVFVAVQLSVHSAVQTEAVPLRDPIYAEKLTTLKGHPEFFADTCDRHRVLAIGSSRTQLCLDAERLSDDRRTVFNFAAAGCGPVTDALYLRRALAAGLKCDTALVEFHPGMLADLTPPFEARWLHPYRLRTDEPNTLRGYGWDIETPPQFQPGAELKAAHTYRFSILNAAHPKLLPCPFGLGFAGRTDGRGHVPGVPVKAEDRPKFVASAYVEYVDAFRDYRPGGPGVAAVRDMLAELRAAGIRPVVLFTPESTLFRSWYGEAGNREVMALAEALAAEFGVPLVHARDWLPDDQFADGHHAIPAGAVTFTDKLGAELRRLGR